MQTSLSRTGAMAASGRVVVRASTRPVLPNRLRVAIRSSTKLPVAAIDPTAQLLVDEKGFRLNEVCLWFRRRNVILTFTTFTHATTPLHAPAYWASPVITPAFTPRRRSACTTKHHNRGMAKHCPPRRTVVSPACLQLHQTLQPSCHATIARCKHPRWLVHRNCLYMQSLVVT